MGNHNVGYGLAAAAEAFWTTMDALGVSPDKDTALKALDAAAERWRGADAEFDDEFFGETPLSRLVAVAFDATPEEIKSRDTDHDDGEAWYDGPQTRFSDRYNFC